MLLSWLAVLGGFALLVWSAERFVHGAAATARNLGVTPLVIGMTIMGFGTSAPEILVSSMAAINGNPAIGIGNALGSNITNIGLVLGVTALFIPLSVSSNTLRREYPALILVTLIAGVLLLDGKLDQGDGALLLAGTFLVVAWWIWLGKHSRGTDPLESEYAAEIPVGMGKLAATLWILLGLVVMVLSSRLLVWGAVNIAVDLGVSDLVIGLTIIAIGTSLPELAASLMSAIKGEDDMAVGNVIGSNIFNLLAVLGLPGIISPSSLDSGVMHRDYPIMLALTLGLFIMAYGFRQPGHINRLQGGLLVTAYVAYLIWLGMTGLN